MNDFAVIGRQVPASEVGWSRPRAMLGDGSDPAVGPSVSDYEAPYRAQSVYSQELASFRPPMRSGDFGLTIRRDLTLGRIQDLVRNDPHVSSALDKLVDHIVGAGLRWSAQPDLAVLLGGRAATKEERTAARDFARQMEAEWRRFAEDPRRFVDAGRRLDFSGLMRLLARTSFTQGENSYVVGRQKSPDARYITAIMPIDPDRICNPYAERDTLTMRLGVEMDADTGAPLAYHVRDAHIGDYWAASEQMSWTKVPRETDWGRPIFVHAFEPLREGDTRGTSPLITLIGKLRMLGRFADNELASATINALFAATIESDMPAEEMADRLRPAATVSSQKLYAADMMEIYGKAPVTMGGVRVPMLLPGSKLSMNSAPRQTTAFPAFETAFLQTISSKLGLAYEQLKMDWSRTNYSSARAALNEVWRGMQRIAKVFITQTVTPLHLAWADEAFDRGFLTEPAGWPKFWDAPGAYLRGRWIGPGRGYVDPVKEMQASSLRVEGLVSTLRDENAEQGRDFEETLDQIEAEREMLAERGLDDLSLIAVVQTVKGPKPDSVESTGPAGVEGDESGKSAGNGA